MALTLYVSPLSQMVWMSQMSLMPPSYTRSYFGLSCLSSCPLLSLLGIAWLTLPMAKAVVPQQASPQSQLLTSRLASSLGSPLLLPLYQWRYITQTRNSLTTSSHDYSTNSCREPKNADMETHPKNGPMIPHAPMSVQQWASHASPCSQPHYLMMPRGKPPCHLFARTE